MRLNMFCYGCSMLGTSKLLHWEHFDSWYSTDENPEECKTLGVRLCV